MTKSLNANIVPTLGSLVWKSGFLEASRQHLSYGRDLLRQQRVSYSALSSVVLVKGHGNLSWVASEIG
jgi:hypothetical protein